MEFATAFGGALLSAFVQPLIEKLISPEFEMFARRENIHADIKDWETMLAQINAVLDDAEDKQVTNSAVKIWLDEFRDLTCDIEDVLDDFNTEAFKPKEMEDSEAITDKLPRMWNEMASNFEFKKKMASRIKGITQRLERLNVRQEKALNLARIANGSRSNQLKEIRMTASLVDESQIYGRDVDKKAILKLLRNEGGNNSMSVIVIWGMGGIGKTTLAQLVYNDSAVEDFFDIKAWVCVSDNFDVTILTRTILHKVDSKIRDLKDLDLDSLQVTLNEKLSQKKFLLILDDVWEEDYNQWDRLRIPFLSSSSSSKIVVTTRKKNAAPITGDSYAYHVKELPDDECLSILARHALGAQSFDAHLDLKDIGQELVKRCDGLPLAAKVLGGLLRNKRSRGEWEIIRNKLWNSPETSKSIHPILKLSYNDLPSHLKRCFVYCAIVPKDYEFDRDELISLWMAEGFLDHPQGGTLMEDLGIDYFEELVSRSFFQLANGNQSMSRFFLRGLSFDPTNSRSVFVIHDLIRNLAQSIAKDACYNYENKSKSDMSGSKYEKVRHASFSLREDSQEYEVYSRMKNLRTIVGFPILRKYDMVPNCRRENCYEFCPQSRCLRVLSLTVCGLPKSIGEMKHLRHLNLSFSPIEQLPESVSSLLNLHTLLLHSCDHLKKLPDKTRNLVNLRHLDIAKTTELLKLPSGIGMLTNLQTLSKFIVDKGDGTIVAELKNLNNLRGSLSIEGLQNVQDARLAILKEKQGLEELVLDWDDHHGRNDMSVLKSLEPHQNLKRLAISSYGGAEFPSWVSNMSQLVSLDLLYCKETKLLPPLGQLRSLKELKILRLEAVETIGVEFYGNVGVPFPSLESLKIEKMSEWREWYDGNMGGEGFPKLQKLELYSCPKLKSFPRMGLPRCQKSIIVRNCDALECFPTIYTGNDEQSLLEELKIQECASLQYFETNFKLPTKLTIENCGNLLSLPDGRMMPDDNEDQPQSRLEYLEIKRCQGLTSLPPGKFPAALKTLEIRRCNLELVSAIFEKNAALEEIYIEANDGMKAFPSIDCLQSLKILWICDCHALESFPETGFLSTSLQVLGLINCQNLSLLPIRIQSQFPSLLQLQITNCPKVVSLLEAGGGPGSLTSLEMGGCKNLRQPIVEWGLCMLSSLETLRVRGRCPATADVKSFSDDNCCWLPTSLKKLNVRDFINLESVSGGLQKLTSLRTLNIGHCPKLRSLPREALPHSLEKLNIYGCPLLKEHYLREKQMGLLNIHNGDFLEFY